MCIIEEYMKQAKQLLFSILILSCSQLLATKQKVTNKKKIKFTSDMLESQAMRRNQQSHISKKILKEQMQHLNGDPQNRQEIEEIARTLIALNNATQKRKHQKAKRPRSGLRPIKK